jgi:23S rRNA (uracil1939-C5)-methyltransferase
MRRQKSDLPVYKNVEIIDAGSEGKAIGKVGDMVVFVPHVVPGDVVDIKVSKKKKSFAEGKAIHFHKYSDKRTEPPCIHFGLCGGCRWQNMAYQHQLYYKQKQVIDNFQRLGKFEFPGIRPIIPSENVYFYRNKLEFTFSNRKWLTDNTIGAGPQNTNGLGFHLPRLFDRIVDIEYCHLQPDPSNAIRLAVKDYALAKGLDFFDNRSWTGFLRNLVIRNTSRKEWMAIMVFHYDEPETILEMMQFIRDKFPFLRSLMYVINPKKNDDVYGLEVRLFDGDPFITEEIPSFRKDDPPLKFKIGPVSFFQTNTDQAAKLYHVAAEFADLKGDELIYDLYCGAGTISNYVAHSCKKVIGIENVASAVDDAKVNSEINAITNTYFIYGDVLKVMNDDFYSFHGKPDVIITDPPRAGMHMKVVEQILNFSPEKVVYVSCNPATQARDISLMAGQYRVENVQPVDMFPHTQHVEDVVLMRRISELE